MGRRQSRYARLHAVFGGILTTAHCHGECSKERRVQANLELREHLLMLGSCHGQVNAFRQGGLTYSIHGRMPSSP